MEDDGSGRGVGEALCHVSDGVDGEEGEGGGAGAVGGDRVWNQKKKKRKKKKRDRFRQSLEGLIGGMGTEDT